MQDLSQSMVHVDPYKMAELNCNLVEISLALYKVFAKLEKVKDRDLVLAVGS